VTVSGGGSGKALGTDSTIVVNASSVIHFSVAPPATATAGSAISFTVTALDATNNTVGSYAGTVHFTSSDAQAVLPADSTLTSGSGAFSATFKTAGNQTLTATDNAVSSITGTSTGTVVSAAAASTTTVASNVPLTFSPNAQPITLNATVTSTSTVNNGSVAFTLLGTQVSADVTNGAASAGFSVSAGTAAGSYTIQAAYSPGTGFAASSDSTHQLQIAKATPSITWANPADISVGTALGATQLNATASVAGTFVYAPTAGTALQVGTGQTLSTTFTPTDSTNYTTAAKSVLINVSKATPVITWAPPAPITYGGALGNGQLNASANTPGRFVYTPPAGAVLGVGNGQTLSVAFTPTDAADYTTASASTTINVNAAPLPPSGVNLVITKVLTRPNGNVVVQLTIANLGGTAANYVTLTSVKVGSALATVLPQYIGTIGANASAQATVSVPGSVGLSGAANTLTAAGTFSGGTFSLSARITLP
jgi:hypothetical protein